MARTGSMISLAGKARRNASSTMPSRPMRSPRGWRKPARTASNGRPETARLDSSHSTAPAGMATVTARPRTKSVRSSRERTRTLPICGRR